MPAQKLPQPDVLIAGAGIIGLTLALELNARGASVTVLDPSAAFRQTSFAAAGMLAAHDPHNPPQLVPLAEESLRLYPDFLKRLEALSGLAVPFQTDTTIQYSADNPPVRLVEHSLDPRQLSTALLAAVRATTIELHEHTGRIDEAETADGLHVRTVRGPELFPKTIIHANGAWFQGRQIILLRKGQMLRVRLPSSLALAEVHRSEHIYIVPRTQGPQAGTALIGATVEDVGFDLSIHRRDLSHLRALGAELIPALADTTAAPEVEAWAGIRPATLDALPLMGPHHPGSRQWMATGHFRNGILLAPATAQAMADLIEGKEPAVDLAAFSPQRF